MAGPLPAKVKFELVSPEKILVSEDVDMVVVPGVEGYFGVLPGHSPFISSLRPGTIDVYDGKNVAERIFVAGGFAEVTTKRCTVLADEAIRVVALDRAAIESERAQLQAQLPALREAAARGEEADALQLRNAENALAAASAKLEALERAAGH
jgi:F-type H+-transporting ATPase subunit epsilon